MMRAQGLRALSAAGGGHARRAGGAPLPMTDLVGGASVPMTALVRGTSVPMTGLAGGAPLPMTALVRGMVCCHAGIIGPGPALSGILNAPHKGEER